MSEKNVLRVASKFLAPVGDRTVRFTISTATKDRDGDTIDQSGWQFGNFLNNPIVLWMHDRRLPPIGKIVSLGNVGGDTVGDVQFATADVNPFADTIFKLVDGGFLNTGSASFAPIRWEINSDGGIDFKEQELLEYSITTIPANPEAMRRACELVGVDKAASFLKFAGETDEMPDARKALLATSKAFAPSGASAGLRLRSADVASSILQLSEV